MKNLIIIVFSLLAAVTGWASDLTLEARIESAMFGDHRPQSNIARNPYRHPVGTLTFLGLQDGMTVMEIWPGGGWYTEILAPVIRHKGQFIVAGYDTDVPDQPEYRYRLQKGLLAWHGRIGRPPVDLPQHAWLDRRWHCRDRFRRIRQGTQARWNPRRGATSSRR